MPFRNLFSILILFFFLCEVMDSSTSFVRESVGPVKQQNKVSSHFQKRESSNSKTVGSLNEQFEDDYDYVTGSSLVVAKSQFTHPKIATANLVPPPFYLHAGFKNKILRPPSLV